MTPLRFHSKGVRDPYRTGYQYRQRVPSPILPMKVHKGFWRWVSGR